MPCMIVEVLAELVEPGHGSDPVREFMFLVAIDKACILVIGRISTYAGELRPCSVWSVNVACAGC